MAGKQSSSKKRQSDKKKNARAGSWAAAQRDHKANFEAQAKREQLNRQAGGMTPWELACQARALRRAVLAAAWAFNPWVPGRQSDREKSVALYNASQKKAVPVAG